MGQTPVPGGRSHNETHNTWSWVLTAYCTHTLTRLSKSLQRRGWGQGNFSFTGRRRWAVIGSIQTSHLVGYRNYHRAPLDHSPFWHVLQWVFSPSSTYQDLIVSFTLRRIGFDAWMKCQGLGRQEESPCRVITSWEVLYEHTHFWDS